MSITAMSEGLRALAERKKREVQERPHKRSKADLVREVYPDIQLAQKAGVSLSEIAETLTEHGLEIQRKTLETILYRIRHPRDSRRSSEESDGGLAQSD